MSGAFVETRAVIRNLRQRGSSSPPPAQMLVRTCPVGEMGGASSHVAFSITHTGSAFSPGSMAAPPTKSSEFRVLVQLAEAAPHGGYTGVVGAVTWAVVAQLSGFAKALQVGGGERNHPDDQPGSQRGAPGERP